MTARPRSRIDSLLAKRLGEWAAEWEAELTRPNMRDDYLEMCAREARMFRTCQSAIVGRLQREADEHAREQMRECDRMGEYVGEPR